MFGEEIAYANPISEQDVAVTIAQYTLSADVPAEERKHYIQYYLLFSKLMALGNLSRADVFVNDVHASEILMLMDMGMFKEARKEMSIMLMGLQQSRSIGGFQTLFGSGGIQRTEHIERVIARQKKKSLSGKITGMFRRDDNEPAQTGEVQE